MGRTSRILEINHQYHGFRKAITYLENNHYVSLSHSDFYQKINSFTAYLNHHGFMGKKIIIIGKNKPEWLIAFFSVFAYIGTAITLDRDISQKEFDNMVNFYQPDLIIYDNDLIINFAKCVSLSFKEVRYIIQNKEPLVLNHNHDGKLILHTSGTINALKSVLLTEENLMSIIPTSIKRNETVTNDRILVIIPLSHIYGLNTCIFQFLSVGAEIILETDIKRFEKVLKETKPTCFAGVPLIFNNVKEKMYVLMGDSLKRKIELSKRLLKLKMDFRKIIFKKVHDYFGGHLRLASTGGSMISQETLCFFSDVGINLFNGYGLTETSGTVALNYKQHFNHASVGKIMDMNDIKIDCPDSSGVGEIIIKGPNVFNGYLNINNQDVFINGYHKTGDLGYIKDDFLFITGRKKKVIIGPNSKNIYPEELESLFTNEKGIFSCKIVMQDDKLHAKIKSSLEDKIIQEVVIKINQELAPYKKIYTFEVVKINSSKEEEQIKVKE